LVEQIVATWSHTSRTSTFPIVQLCGSEVTAKYSIAAATCASVGFNLNVMEASVLPPNPHELNHLIQRWFREALLTNSALLLNCDEVNQADSVREFAISQFIENLNSPLIVSSQERQHPRQRPLITFDVPALTHSEQLAIWNSNLGTAAAELNGQVEALASQFNLSTPAILTICLKVKGEMERRQEEENSESPIQNPKSKIQNHLWDICRTMARPRLDDLAQRMESTALWEDLILPEQQRQTLRDIGAHVRQRAKVYQSWGFAGKGGRGLGISALFSGASGTGKTMAAEVLAQELRLDLYRIDLSAVVSKYIGETEKNLRRIFDAAETGGAILLFDEADALFGKRTEVKDSHDRHANVEVSYLLQRMEAYQGLAILTTNLKGSLDQAFLRRIRFVIPFPFPDAKARAEIWQRIFPSRTPTQELDVNLLGKLNVAGGNIRNIALNAAFLAAEAGEAVMMKHILQAAKSEYLKLERSLTDAEIRGWL
jgi:ATP-dependent 26S proteasome regulatory subunit